MSMLVELSLSRSQPCTRSRKDASQQRWVAFRVLGSSLISEKLPLKAVPTALCLGSPAMSSESVYFPFCQGCYESEIHCLNVKHWGAAGTRISSIGRFFLHLSEPRMYSFELFDACDKYSVSVLTWLHLRISKHCKSFNDLGDTVPALIKINSNTPFDVSSSTVMPQAL